MICSLCPRHCANRGAGSEGYCGADACAVVSKTMLHHWEEPPVSGTNGSGAVFFAGCNMSCVFCQNAAISQTRPLQGKAVSTAALEAVYWALAAQGAHNINLVSPNHVLPAVRESIQSAKASGFKLPFVWNSNAYETTTALQSLAGLVDIYLPDFKYADNALACSVSNAPNYYETAAAAILEMYGQVGELTLDGNGLAKRGLLVRHMVLPGFWANSNRVLAWLHNTLPGGWISLLAQYTPRFCQSSAAQLQNLRRRLTTFEYNRAKQFLLELGETNVFVQERSAATCDFTPEF
jgi:putative pyruvate formate lyase activating enzyme